MASIGLGRWVAKKGARQGMATGSWALGQVGTRPGSSRLRVLTYHRFGDSTRDPFCVSRPAFEQQMRWVAEKGRAVSLAQVEEFVAGRGTLPDGAVLVTMDDGCRSVFTDALPVLRDHGVPAVAYVPAALVGEREIPGYDEPVMTWDEMARLPEAGIAVGSHAFHHRSLGLATVEEAREEAVRSRELLGSRLGTPVSSFAYPFGTRADYSDATRRILAEAGYATAFTSQHGAIEPGLDPLELPRIKVEGGDPGWMFPLLCAGAMDGWALVDRGLWRIQR
jgi:peptidoglycan/xylan/chitin deacetylase (PgdA/CDA1 family)